MRHRWIASSLILAGLLFSPAMAEMPRPKGSPDPCSENFKPPSGTVSERQQVLVPERTVQKVLEQKNHELKCRRKETDAVCLERARKRWGKRLGDRELSAWLHTPEVGVDAQIRVDGKRVTRRFADHQKLARFMKALVARGKEVILVSSQVAHDPKRRSARITIRRMGQGKLKPYLKVSYTWAHGGGGEVAARLKAMHDLAHKTRRALLHFSALDTGRVKLLFQCPAPPKEKP